MSANDKRRFRAFADFIRKTYPDAEKVADVAGGHGKLSYFLWEFGYEATVSVGKETAPLLERALTDLARLKRPTPAERSTR